MRMDLFGNKNPQVVYTCHRLGISRVVVLGDDLSYPFLMGLRDIVNRCEAKNGPCPENCEIKKLLSQYSGGGKESK